MPNQYPEWKVLRLTPMQKKIIPLVAEGLRDRFIAKRLKRSENTIGVQLSIAMKRFGVHTRQELVNVTREYL